jgi:hypothetical protein
MLEGRIGQDTCRPRRLKVTAGSRGSYRESLRSDSALVPIYTITASLRCRSTAQFTPWSTISSLGASTSRSARRHWRSGAPSRLKCHSRDGGRAACRRASVTLTPPQVEMCGQSCQVIGIMVHVVAVARLARPAVATPVMRDHTMAVAQEEQHLSVPIVRRKRPAMAEHDGLRACPNPCRKFRYRPWW